MKLLMIVPARGQSRAIPKKVLQLIHGIPLLERTLSYLKNVHQEQIVVVTDDDDIAKLAIFCGCQPIMEPLVPPDEENQLRAIEWAVNRSEDSEYIGVLNATSPLHPTDIIKRAIQKLERSGPEVDGIIILAPSSENPHRMIMRDDVESDQPVKFMGIFTERQKQPSYCVHTGFHIWKRNNFIKLPKASIKDFWRAAVYLGIVREGICFDVDTPSDLELLRAMYEYGIN